MWKSIGKACGWRHPRALSARALLQDDKATPVFLTFLRETEVGKAIGLAPPEERGRRKERGAGPAHLESAPFPLSFLCLLYTFPSAIFPSAI